MNRELLSKVITRIQPINAEIKVQGYSDEEIKAVLDELIEQGVVTRTKNREMSPILHNETIRKGSVIRVQDTGRISYGYYLSEWKLKEIYGMDMFGRDI